MLPGMSVSQNEGQCRDLNQQKHQLGHIYCAVKHHKALYYSTAPTLRSAINSGLLALVLSHSVMATLIILCFVAMNTSLILLEGISSGLQRNQYSKNETLNIRKYNSFKQTVKCCSYCSCVVLCLLCAHNHTQVKSVGFCLGGGFFVYFKCYYNFEEA